MQKGDMYWELCWLCIVFLHRCYVNSNRDHAPRKFWWIINTASFSLCFIPVPGNQVWTYGKLTTLKMKHRASASKCCAAVSWTFSHECILFPLSLPREKKYSIFSLFLQLQKKKRKKTNKVWNTLFAPFFEKEGVLGFLDVIYAHLKDVNWYFSSKQTLSITTKKTVSPIV